MVGKCLWDFTLNIEMVALLREKLEAGEMAACIGLPHFDKNSPDHPESLWDITIEPIHHASGQMESFLLTGKERPVSAKASTENQGDHERLLTILDSLEAVVYVADMNTYEVLYVNAAGVRILGEAVGKTCWKVFQSGQTGPCEFCTNGKLITPQGAPAEPYIWEFRNTVTNRWFHIVDRAIQWVDGRLVRMEMAFDITERKEMEEKYRELLEFNNNLLEKAPLGIAALDKDFNVVYANHEIREILGDSLNPGPDATRVKITALKPFQPLGGPQDLSRLAEGSTLSFERMLRQDIGMPRHVSVKGAPIINSDGFNGAILMMQDITERRALETRLVQTHKMEAVGALAKGVAHDFNNILHSMMGLIELARLSTPEVNESRNYLKQALTAGQRASDLIQQILTFSQERVFEYKEIDLPAIIETALNEVKRTMPPSISVKTIMEKTIWGIYADPLILMQVLISLFSNAIYAMKPNGGELAVTLISREMDPESVRIQPNVLAGAVRSNFYAELTVSDTGCGMTGEVMERIFEPFFTTKPLGEGNGMGLAIAHGVILKLNGAIAVKSNPGKGTSVTLYLPRTGGF
ncbi:MAG: PAS domain-containing protein [Nitrospinae bacterium]|nr:PAS domain-containing protein [Nitrospinota bacterium]